MPIVPDTISGKIQFFEEHLPVWTADPTTIGLTPAQVTQLASLTTAARTAFDAAQTVRMNSRTATQTQNRAVADMADFGSDLIKTIRAFAQTSGDESVYELAAIPAPAPPTPAPPPTTPAGVAAVIDASGNVVITWESENAAPHTGAYFTVRRKLESQAGYEEIGASGSRRFIDASIPHGTVSARYQVRAHRGELQSAWCQAVVVQFSPASSAEGGLTLAA